MNLHSPGPVKVVINPDDSVKLTSHPPFFSALVSGSNGRWSIRVDGHWSKEERTFVSRSRAMESAATLIAALALRAWRFEMTGAQRTAIGQVQCPYQLGFPLCRQAPEPGSIWCAAHRNGHIDS